MINLLYREYSKIIPSVGKYIVGSSKPYEYLIESINEFYSQYISPYKGELELWYQKKISFRTDFIIIFLTLWVVLFPKSNLVFKVFTDLPVKPDFLK